jgi:hypothetical protein
MFQFFFSLDLSPRAHAQLFVLFSVLFPSWSFGKGCMCLQKLLVDLGYHFERTWLLFGAAAVVDAISSEGVCIIF